MKNIIFLLSLCTYLFSSSTYYVTYGSITLGDIKNIDTIKDGYLIATPSSSFIKFILGFDNYVIYQENKKPKVKGDTKYKKDKYLILNLINKLQLKREKKQTFKKNNQSITILCKNDICTYIRKNLSKNKTYKGRIIFKNDKFISICDNQDDICIKR